MTRPKFKIGDVVSCAYDSNWTSVITEVHENSFGYTYSLRGTEARYNEKWLIPYQNEKEVKMKNEKLNLCELLKGCENEIFWNPLLGYVTVTLLQDDKLICIHKGDFTVYIASDGTDNDGNMALFPSKEQRDWIEWLDNASFLAVDKNGEEWIFAGKPVRYEDIWTYEASPESAVRLPKGSIFKLINKKLTWNDDPVRLKIQ